MFLVRVFEKKEEEVLFIFYFNANAKSPINGPFSPNVSIPDVSLEEEEALFIFEFWTYWRVDQNKICSKMLIELKQIYCIDLKLFKPFLQISYA